MTKDDAIKIFGTTASDLARAVQVEPQAIYQWPDVLGKRQLDAVAGACLRLRKKIPAELRKRPK